jgi:hypothetical protein
MPDGEVLTGNYRVAFGGGEAMTFAGSQVATTLLITDGPVQFAAGGPKTQVLCRGANARLSTAPYGRRLAGKPRALA